ncbi:MAG TPA: hypothetical protein VFB52_03025, partial [Solirubrobacterales bacterium]|nr:hypothetical protein [Solirubrobacterales bacterium]
MRSKGRVTKVVLLLAALVALGVVISGCAFIKAGSLAVSQPGGVGTVRVHFALCNQPADEDELQTCAPNESKEETTQYLLGIAVPPGSVPPETVTAVAVGGGAPIVFHRNAEVTAQIGSLSGIEEGETKVPVWPPAGTEGVGYLSDPYVEETGTTRELTVDADFGLPVPADGGAFGGPFRTALAFGLREVSPAQPANRPVQCVGPASPPSESLAFCIPTGFEAQAGTSDLRIKAPKTTTAFVGGKAPLKFGLSFASTAGALPTFAMKATTSLKGGKASVANPAFVPGNVDPTTHRSPAANSTANVSIPKKAKPGTYEVVLTATTPQGGTVTQVAKLKVTKPKLKLGATKLDKAKGTATLEVKVP